MKIEKLDEDKLKITLSIDDLEERNINLHAFMYNSPESQDLFWELIQRAEKECGFNVDDSVICVEASTSGGGNFTLMVTKTNEKPPISKIQVPKIKSIPNYKLKRKSASLKFNKSIYIFETFDDLCDFCNICDCSIVKQNKLYTMDNLYYLQSEYVPYNIILDYATLSKSPEILEAKLNEYGTVVIEKDALQTISENFNNKKRKKKPSGK